jgi:hypothetical protein
MPVTPPADLVQQTTALMDAETTITLAGVPWVVSIVGDCPDDGCAAVVRLTAPDAPRGPGLTLHLTPGQQLPHD